VDNDAIRRAAKTIPNGKLCEIADASHAFWLERDDLLKIWWDRIDGFMADCHAAFDRKNKPVNDNGIDDNDRAQQQPRKPKPPQAKGS
jgi:pimeloyl-ACP methyl ester carboxylesterase